MSNIEHVPCSVMRFSEDTDSGNLQKVKVVVMHTDENANKTFIGDDAVNSAEPTLKNVPILAYIKRDEDGEAIDFDQHNVITKIVQGENGHEVKQYFLERPIGLIPETNNYRIEEIDGMNHVVVDGYIWKTYSNEGLDLINETSEKGVSMEISVEDGFKDKKTGLYHITKYSYLGVTVLGDDVPPAMGDTCKLSTYSSNEEYQFALQELKNEIQKTEKEAQYMSNPNTTEPVVNNDPVATNPVEPVQEPVQGQDPVQEPTQEPTNTEPVEPTQEPTGQDPVQANFSLSIENMSQGIRNTLSGMTTQKTNRWNETYNVQSYWLRTIVPSESVVVVEDGISDYTYYGVPFSLNGDEVVLDFDNKKEYIQTWREKNTGTETLVFSERDNTEKEMIDAKFSENEKTITELNTKVSDQETELEQLRAFKLDKDQEALANEVNTIVANFSSCLDEDEYKEVRDKALSKEMDLGTFKTHMYALRGMKQEQLEKEQAENYSVKGNKGNTEPIKIPVTSATPEPKKCAYGSLHDELQAIATRNK